MLITDKFVLLHVPRTGGTFLTELVREHAKVLEERPSHAGWWAIPSEYRSLPAYAVVRNPWDWYVSWYELNLQRQFIDHDLCLQGFDHALRSWHDSNEKWGGLYGAYFWRIAGAGWRQGSVTVGRFETLREDFATFLNGQDSLRESVLTAPAANTTAHRDYRTYYAPETCKLIGERNERIVRLFGYEF